MRPDFGQYDHQVRAHERRPFIQDAARWPPSTNRSLSSDSGGEWDKCDATGMEDSPTTHSMRLQMPTTPAKFTPIRFLRGIRDRVFGWATLAAVSPTPTKIMPESQSIAPTEDETLSMRLHKTAFQERNKLVALRRDHGAQRRLLKDVLRQAAAYASTPSQPNLSQKCSSGEAQEVWQTIFRIMDFLVKLEAEMDASDKRLNGFETNSVLKSDAASSDPVTTEQNAILNDIAPAKGYDKTVASDEPYIVQEYYRQIGAVTYISDALLELGPRPTEQSSEVSHDGHRGPYTEDMTPQEYAKRHLELVIDLRYAREAKAWLKQLCLQNNHELEEVDGMEDDSYAAAVDSVAAAPARIDSLLQGRNPSRPLLTTTRHAVGSRIENWVAEVRSTSPDSVSPLPTSQPETHSTPIHMDPHTSSIPDILVQDTPSDSASPNIHR